MKNSLIFLFYVITFFYKHDTVGVLIFSTIAWCFYLLFPSTLPFSMLTLILLLIFSDYFLSFFVNRIDAYYDEYEKQELFDSLIDMLKFSSENLTYDVAHAAMKIDQNKALHYLLPFVSDVITNRKYKGYRGMYIKSYFVIIELIAKTKKPEVISVLKKYENHHDERVRDYIKKAVK